MSSKRTDMRGARLARALAGVLVVLALAAPISTAAEERETKYKATEAGHPLRIAAYVLHPVGVILDRLIFRPAYWLGSQEPIKTLVGQTDD